MPRQGFKLATGTWQLFLVHVEAHALQELGLRDAGDRMPRRLDALGHAVSAQVAALYSLFEPVRSQAKVQSR